MPIRNLFVYPRTDLMQIYMANKDYSIRQEQLARFAKAMGHPARIAILQFLAKWKSHATLTLLAKQDLAPFGYNMIDPLKSWCWGSILFYPFKISRFS